MISSVRLCLPALIITSFRLFSTRRTLVRMRSALAIREAACNQGQGSSLFEGLETAEKSRPTYSQRRRRIVGDAPNRKHPSMVFHIALLRSAFFALPSLILRHDGVTIELTNLGNSMLMLASLLGAYMQYFERLMRIIASGC